MIMKWNPAYDFLDMFVILYDVDDLKAPLVELYVNMMGAECKHAKFLASLLPRFSCLQASTTKFQNNVILGSTFY